MILKAIPLVVSPMNIQTKELPILELENRAKGKRRLVTAGGQHYVNTVEEWMKTLHWQYSKLVKE